MAEPAILCWRFTKGAARFVLVALLFGAAPGPTARETNCKSLGSNGGECVQILEAADHTLLRAAASEGSTERSLCLPTLAGKRDLRSVRFPGISRTLLVAKFDGNRGTNLNERILAVFDLRDVGFVPVMFETVGYVHNYQGFRRELAVDVSFEAAKRVPRVQLISTLSASSSEEAGEPLEYHLPFQEQLQWRRILEWSEASGSFYDEPVERDRLSKSEVWVERNIARQRLVVLKQLIGKTVTTLCDGAFLDVLNTPPIIEIPRVAPAEGD